jgi:hypothetical protein
VIEASSAPIGPAVQQLGTGQHDHEHRRLAARLHHELREVEQAVARPVKVFEHDHERCASRYGLQGGAPGGEELVFVDALGAHLADRGRKQLRIVVGIFDAEAAQPLRDVGAQV